MLREIIGQLAPETLNLRHAGERCSHTADQRLQINSWYAMKNMEFGDVSPREYFRDKDWKDRFQVGIDALKDRGVIKR